MLSTTILLALFASIAPAFDIPAIAPINLIHPPNPTNTFIPIPPPAPATYKILSAVIDSQWGANTGSMETFNVTLEGTGAGALPVLCSVTWDAMSANGVPIPVISNFVCTDSAVIVTLARMNVVDFLGWDVTVHLMGLAAAVWRQKDLTTPEKSPGWTCSNYNGAVCTFDGGVDGVNITGIPPMPLAQFVKTA